jgi:RNA polymerase sigma-70 factor (ECF subfamily)
MPPFDGWYQGPENIVLLSKTHCPAEAAGDMRFIRTTANGQPAAALYIINRETGVHEPLQMHVMAVRPDGISHVVAFHMSSFEQFGLPASL